MVGEMAMRLGLTCWSKRLGRLSTRVASTRGLLPPGLARNLPMDLGEVKEEVVVVLEQFSVDRLGELRGGERRRLARLERTCTGVDEGHSLGHRTIGYINSNTCTKKLSNERLT